MKNIWSWLGGSSGESCGEHKSKFIKVCCNDSCKNDRNICESANCLEQHRGHSLMDYQKFKSIEAQATKEVRYRQQIEDCIHDYYEKYLEILKEMFKKEESRLVEQIDKKFYTKNFLDFYRRYTDGRDYYSLLPDLQLTTSMEISEAVRKKIKEKEKQLFEVAKESLATEKILLSWDILIHIEKPRQILSLSKIEKIKSILPFQCELTLKFQASKNKFMTHNLYERGIRGPIVLVAESYKNRTFGGYSPIMFPKQDRYEADTRCKSFLFSLDDRVILPLKEEYKKFAIRGGSNLWFGRGDLAISDECNKANISWAEIGRAYEAPKYVHGKVSEWLAGALYFRVTEYEIYEVQTSFQK